MVNTREWNEEIYQDVLKNQKRLVFVGGASCSGKSTNADMLVSYLGERGIKALHVEADMYYKGVMWIILEKTLARDEFRRYLGNFKQIYDCLIGVNKKDELKDKFKNDNLSAITKGLSEILDKQDVQSFLYTLLYEHANINFDEPSTNNYKGLAKDLKTLLNGGEAHLSRYSFNTAEAGRAEKPTNGSDYDVFVVEGLYMLRPEILKHFDEDLYTTAFVDGDSATLVERRFDRDIGSANRTTMPHWQTMTLMLTKVMPAYYNYIMPTRGQAKHICQATITKGEIEKRRVSSQVKFPLTESQYKEVLALMDSEPVSCGLQQDIFFNCEHKSEDLEVRVRAVDGKATNLTFKMGEDTSNRRMSNYDLTQIFKGRDLSFNDVLKAMGMSGFTIDYRVDKYRQTFMAEGENGQFKINIDDMLNKGKYIEFDGASSHDIQAFARWFNLSNEIRKSYADHLKEQQAEA